MIFVLLAIIDIVRDQSSSNIVYGIIIVFEGTVVLLLPDHWHQLVHFHPILSLFHIWHYCASAFGLATIFGGIGMISSTLSNHQHYFYTVVCLYNSWLAIAALVAARISLGFDFRSFYNTRLHENPI